MDVPILIILILATGICLAWFGFKIMKMVVKVVFIAVILAVLGFIVYQFLL